MNRRHLFFQFAAAVSGHLGVVPIMAQVESESLPPGGEIPEWLERWRRLPRLPLWESADLTLGQLIRAIEHGRSVRVIYEGGSTPGEARLFTPELIFRTREDDTAAIYISGWCHVRQAHRTLRLDRLRLAFTEDV